MPASMVTLHCSQAALQFHSCTLHSNISLRSPFLQICRDRHTFLHSKLHKQALSAPKIQNRSCKRNQLPVMSAKIEHDAFGAAMP